MANAGKGGGHGFWKHLASMVVPVGIGLAAAPVAGGVAGGDDPHAQQRAAMVDAVRAYAQGPASAPELALDERVLAVMHEVPRHRFVPPAQRDRAYEDRPLPIGRGQTISQPYIVALMTSLLQVEPHHSVLEIGTGSGYQAAILARLAAQVRTIEIVPELGRRAAADLKDDFPNVETRIGDGYAGWPEAAPFDRIMVTAAAPYIPRPLVEQLAPGGRMVIPVGPEASVQNLVLLTRDMDGRVAEAAVLPVQFVPLTR